MPTGPTGEKRLRNQTSADTNIPDPQDLHRSIFSMDNIHVLRAMNTDSVDLIYLDPPFNSNKEYSSPIGSKAAGAAFKDTWTLSDVDLLQHNLLKKVNETLYALIYAAGRAHSKGMFSYLMMMAPRLVELKRVLKPTGSIYLHCDPTAGHYLKMLMDAIFGQHVFRNEIIWHYRTSSGAPKNHFVKNTDMLLFYAKTEDSFFNVLREPWPDRTLKKWQKDEIGIYRMNDGKKYYIDPKGKRMDNVWQITLSSRSRERTGYPHRNRWRFWNASSRRPPMSQIWCWTRFVAARLHALRRKCWVGSG